jgi:dTDP-4-amino-4,6-dideoxygalactose transaminase
MSDLYERGFGFHDQGHKPSRMGVEVGNRSIVGMNMRMNELTGAVALAQLRKLDNIITVLHRKKKMLKTMLEGIPNIKFRTINDPAGECATLLTLIFETKGTADKFCEKIGVKPLSSSGWHVYNNMEQILNKMTADKANCPYNCDKLERKVNYEKHMLPATDDILERAVNISVGVSDKGLGSGFGININSRDDEIEKIGTALINIIKVL